MTRHSSHRVIASILVTLVVVVLVAWQETSADLVSHWSLDEGTAAAVNNSVFGGPNGTLTNTDATNWVPGHNGTGFAVYLDGTDESANLSTNATLDAIGGLDSSDNPTPFSTSAWIKTDASGGWFRTAAAKFGGTPMWGLGWMGSEQLGFVIRGTGVDVRLKSPTNSWGLDDNWHLLHGVRGGGKISFFGDGQLLAEAVDVTGTGDASNTADFKLGSHNGTQFVKQTLDDVAIWDQALTPYAVDMMHKRDIAPTTAAAATNAILDDSPIAYWRLEETGVAGANLAADFSGNGHTATYQNAVVQGGSRPLLYDGGNRVATFDGVNDFIGVNEAIDDADFVGADGSYSIELWFNAAERHQGDLLGFTATGTNDHAILVQVEADGRLRFLHRAPAGGGGGTDIYTDASTDPYTDDQWHHLVAVKDGSLDQMRLYLDGDLAGSATDATTINFDLDLGIGRLGKSYSGRYFNGMIDEISLYNWAFTAEDAVAHRMAAVPEPSTLLLTALGLLGLACYGWRRK